MIFFSSVGIIMHVLALAFVTTKHMGVLIVCMLLLCESILYIYIYIYIYQFCLFIKKNEEERCV